MTNEVKWLLEELIKYGSGFTVAGIVLYMLVTRWLSSYLNEKGKNLATKEDVAKITDLVKGVEHQYNVLLEEMKSKQQLRMAALDRRLQVHQESFTFWQKLVGERIEGELHPVIQCQEWWYKNCLYLEPEVRAAFSAAYHAAHSREQSLAARDSGQHVIDAWKELMAFPTILFGAIKLPELSPKEKEQVEGIPGTPWVA